MSIALVVTAGFGNGTLTGSIADVVTRGYTIGEVTADYTIDGKATQVINTAYGCLKVYGNGENWFSADIGLYGAGDSWYPL